MSAQQSLAVRIQSSLEEIDLVVERAINLQVKALTSEDDGYWDGVALNLHGFYGGIERILEDIARTIDESIPEGADWHRALLYQMAGEMSGRRPAVIRLGTRQCLDEYRGFRHVVRNVYAFNFRPERLKDLVDGMQSCYVRVKADLLGFVGFLSSVG